MKRKYVKDYVTDETGQRRFRYTGKYYHHEISKQRRKKMGIIQILIAGIEIILLVAAGFMDCPGMYTFYVLLPMVCMLLPIIYYMIGSYSFIRNDSPMERFQYEESFHRMMKSVAGGLFFNIVALCGDIILVIRNISRWETYEELILLALLFILTAVNIYAAGYQNRLLKQVTEV